MQVEAEGPAVGHLVCVGGGDIDEVAVATTLADLGLAGEHGWRVVVHVRQVDLQRASATPRWVS